MKWNVLYVCIKNLRYGKFVQFPVSPWCYYIYICVYCFSDCFCSHGNSYTPIGFFFFPVHKLLRSFFIFFLMLLNLWWEHGLQLGHATLKNALLILEVGYHLISPTIMSWLNIPPFHVVFHKEIPKLYSSYIPAWRSTISFQFKCALIILIKYILSYLNPYSFKNLFSNKVPAMYSLASTNSALVKLFMLKFS